MASFADFVASRPAAEQAQADILHYTEVLCEALAQNFRSRNNGKLDGYTFTIETARKYHRVIMTTGGGSRSIHAFVDTKNGDVYKAASWKAPAKHVRFNVLDEASRELMLSKADWSGGYLYLTK